MTESCRADLGEVVIIGGGVIGCSIAYHLSELDVKVTVIEKTSVACAASGKAGGFLARTWCDGTPVGPLARASFDLLKKYGEKFDCDYRPVDTLRVQINTQERINPKNKTLQPDWLDNQNVVTTEVLGNTSNTAQLHPYKLSHCYIEHAKSKGSQVVIGNVVGLKFDQSDESQTTMKTVLLEDGSWVKCDTLILAMGPWTSLAASWFQYQIPVITAERSHSVIVKTDNTISAHVLFLEYQLEDGSEEDPEVYPRPDGTVYICGYTDQQPIPANASQVEVSEPAVKSLNTILSSLSNHLKDSKVIAEQACYLPIPEGKVPVIGKIPNHQHVYIAAGHYCWGILNSAATGKALSDLIVTGHSDIDLSPFNPAHFI